MTAHTLKNSVVRNRSMHPHRQKFLLIKKIAAISTKPRDIELLSKSKLRKNVLKITKTEKKFTQKKKKKPLISNAIKLHNLERK